ncbi:alpha/beta-hydrolase [Leucogyrophana mollusca]|uniref:Alpha/beta-hydrolase n=1 Tax=Leucogyrophana mollusca TaxID=85980 RepID=A0ACB8BG90_9AGAM|nr:alpha/beta-hydrolase [Leucogyrophana mollusca]
MGTERPLRKRSSFLSSRRDTDKLTVSPNSIPVSPTPLYAPKSYFEIHPRPQTSPARSSFHAHDLPRRHARRSDPDKGKEKAVEPSYAFPTSDSAEEVASFLSSGDITPRHPRMRTRTGPSTKSKWKESSIPPLRFSGSSSLAETPPQTPDDTSSIGNFSLDNFPVVVPAPVSGVEAMDALVDGMNGFTAEDFFGRSSSSRSRFAIPGHHPLYQPPLPTPPPGVVLGKGSSKGKLRKPEKFINSDEDDDPNPPPPSRPPPRRTHAQRPNSARKGSTSTITVESSLYDDVSPSVAGPSADNIPSARLQPDRPRAVIPSISEIIRSHAHAQLSRPSSARMSSYSHSNGHSTMVDEESEPEPLTADEEAELLTSARTSQQSFDPINFTTPPASVPQAIAEYLRSARLTTLLKLTRYPHASLDHPLTVSLADMGDPNGFPLIVFLGLGCVRHILGLYDEMADCLGLRLIAIDRWGLGRTESPQSKSSKGIMEWASAVEEVLDLLNIYECSVMAHSAGAPYALSFANRIPERIRGDLCLLAPWVGGGESGGYKWLKYVPNGILKTAQAAEWKIQAWMIGKPPTVAYRGIGYTAPPSPIMRNGKNPSNSAKDLPSRVDANGKNTVYHSEDPRRRMSVGSSLFSDYDDLRDFDGRFGSQSTLGARSMTQQSRRKPSKGFLGRLKSAKSTSQPPSPVVDQTPQTNVGKKLKNLRSMGSLKGKSSSTPVTMSKKLEAPSPCLPQPLTFDVGLGLGDIDWIKPVNSVASTPPPTKPNKSADLSDKSSQTHYSRQGGRRSISFSTPRSSPPSMASSPRASTFSSPSVSVATTSTSYQAALGNALIAASHAEASKGTHSDLLQILNHDHRPWGFSYSDYPHKVHVWYGDKDEKIAENAVRWMERAMGEDRCQVKVVKGADHSLMYKSSVVVEVLERVREFW